MGLANHTGNTDTVLDEVVALIQKRHPKPATTAMEPEVWVQEGFALRNQVYAFEGLGTRDDPARLSDQYSLNAREIAFERPAAAGYRLAEFLNRHLP